MRRGLHYRRFRDPPANPGAPRWLAVSGTIISFLLIVAVFFSGWIGLLFPLWIFALSLDILFALRRQSARN